MKNLDELRARREAFEEVIESINQILNYEDIADLKLQIIKSNLEGRILTIEQLENLTLNDMAWREKERSERLDRQLADVRVNYSGVQ